MVDVFQNWANFWQRAFSTLVPPSSYTMTKVSKISWASQLSYEILYSSFEWKFRKDKLHFYQKTPPKSPHQLGLISFSSNEKKGYMQSYSLTWPRKSSFTLLDFFFQRRQQNFISPLLWQVLLNFVHDFTKKKRILIAFQKFYTWCYNEV